MTFWWHKRCVRTVATVVGDQLSYSAGSLLPPVDGGIAASDAGDSREQLDEEEAAWEDDDFDEGVRIK